MNHYAYIGKNIKTLREQKRVKQKQLAKDLDVSAAYLNAVENGKKKPSLNLILSIAEEFKIDPAEIVTKDESIKKIKALFEHHQFESQLSKINEVIQALKKMAKATP